MSTADQAAVPAALPTWELGSSSRWIEFNFRELWAYRELLYFFVWRDLKVRYKQTAIGAAWVVLQPLLSMAIFSVVFGKLAKIPSEGLPYPLFYYIALLPWLYFSSAMTNATATMVDNQKMITKVFFPRVLLPLAAVFSGLVDFGISFILLAGMMAYYRVVPTRNVLWLPVFLLLAVVSALGIGLWLSALNALYRDVRYVVPFLVQFGLFASPIAYPVSLVPQKWRWLYGLNPMAAVIEGFRWSLTGHGQPLGVMGLVSGLMVVLLVIGGLIYFQKMEGAIADRI